MTSKSLPDLAITAALAQNWKEAIRTNSEILKENRRDADALSRLAFAYLKIGKITLAKQTYEKVLSIDQYNQIALKNLKKLSSLKKKQLEQLTVTSISPLVFLEEPGKTKIVDCIHVAPPSVLTTLSTGQEVQLKPRSHCVEVRSMDNVYLGALPDDISFKLIKYFASGNTYSVVIKSIEKNTIKVLLRELTRGKRFANQPSFTTNSSYVPFSRGTSMSEAINVTPTGEENEEATPERNG